MKKAGFVFVAVVIFCVIVYVTIIIEIIEILFGAILFIAAAIILWIIWNKIKDTVEDTF
ncbi:hypothetical protein RM549_18930 [Salegentibacter sp. F188]|uniref:Uncharacterized protein n=1 Tax=Autumnicola patrickiae TaxID=3075591 RepID=A0ABU3E883_9FLAO|nr:hypothetical protein [Salegentibacter sp. F188]MDT0691874.1 hypothetical protein [Salegentibacter sp. F188]